MKQDIDFIKLGKDIISEQLKSLKHLQDQINVEFADVVNLIFNSSGRLMIIGLGKSGIIGRKISATLNSTGTLSSFIHASDALHGDLGSLVLQDIVLFISKSGNTEEIKQLIPIIKARKIQIVAMTANLNSYLAKESDYVLNVSINQEVCPNNLAPTTSTTLQLVMGDTLAVCLMKLNNFSTDDFARLHPGGMLGNRLNLAVKDLCDFSLKPFVDINDPLEKVIVEISSKRLGATAVLESNTIIGVITDGDLRRMLAKKSDLSDILASDLMTIEPKIIDLNDLAYHAFSIMKNHSITQLLVHEKNKYMGVIHLHDILKRNIF
ncbi:MAG: D-arabinose 5-phosphate isomerase [Flavobacteriales bacterium]|nr:D-arabinose 5-phosphate isomerase [Flavobacteriales bacterium]|tara:strand:+ start:1081 stop:2046 length:966 start_codon:yes stop_codon:yes gene_type:complete